MLGQAEIAKYLDQCNGSRLAIEEVLSAYIVWWADSSFLVYPHIFSRKYLKGATSERVLSKLRYLSIFLRVTYVFGSRLCLMPTLFPVVVATFST
jgi:hypothetical protein